MPRSLPLILALTASTTGAAPQVRMSQTQHDEKTVEVVMAKDIRPEQGFCYIASLRLGREGDSKGKSACSLLEDGKPLGPARAAHADIRQLGQGRYSHWTQTALYFSASDNTDPRANGRKYELVSERRLVVHSAETVVTDADAAYRVAAPAGRAFAQPGLALRNLDDRAAVAVTLVQQDRPDFTSKEAMLASILKPGMSDEQKAIAIWQFLRDWRYHFYPAEAQDEIHDPVKFLCVYGYGFCDDCATNFAILCRAAGLRARAWGLGGHVVGEAFFDNGWRMFDPDHEVYYRNAAGAIASVEELAAHPEIITATPRDPTGYDSAALAKLYTTTEDNAVIERTDYAADHRLVMVLQPGDEAVFDSAPGRLCHIVAFPEQPLPPVVGNGRLTRRLSPAAGGDTVWSVAWPYVFLSGELRLAVAPGEKVEAAISADGKTFAELPLRAGAKEQVADLEPWIKAQKRALYACSLRVRRPAGAAPAAAAMTLGFQFAPRTLPQVTPGGAAFRVQAQTPARDPRPADFKGLAITHTWAEDTAKAAR